MFFSFQHSFLLKPSVRESEEPLADFEYPQDCGLLPRSLYWLNLHLWIQWGAPSDGILEVPPLDVSGISGHETESSRHLVAKLQ